MIRFQICFLALFSSCLLYAIDSSETPWEEDPNTIFDTYQHADVEAFYFGQEEEKEVATNEAIEDFQVHFEKEEKGPYRLKAGDVLFISIYGEEGTEREVTIDPTGSISYLLVNSLFVLGKTIPEVREALEEKLKSYYRFVNLSITPIQFSGEFYTIMGEVNIPGKKLINGNPTITSALCEAGGFTSFDFRERLMDQANLERSFLSRNGEFVPVDFVRLVKHGDMSQDVPLRAGDSIYIDTADIYQVFVLGEVGAPMPIDFVDRMSLAQAISEAGGLNEYASPRALVLRGSLTCPVRYSVDVKNILKGCACDFPLEPGDIVYVPLRRFTTLEILVKDAIRTFVGVLASGAGVEAFYSIHPHARNDDDNFTVVPIIGP